MPDFSHRLNNDYILPFGMVLMSWVGAATIDIKSNGRHG